MKMSFDKKLRLIEKELEKFYTMEFETELKELVFNTNIKNKIKELIIDYNSHVFVLQSLTLLAQYTGCMEDEKIADLIIDDLVKNNYVTKEQLGFFYERVGTNRWS